MIHAWFIKEKKACLKDKQMKDIIKSLITILISGFLLVACACNPVTKGNPPENEGDFVDTIVYGDSKKVCAAYIALWGVYDPENKKHRAWTADDIRGDLLTDLILSFATLSDKDHVSLELGDYNSYKSNVDKVHAQYKDLRISLAIGGASEGTEDFSKMAADKSLRGKFVANVESFLKNNLSVSGIDIDWEYPGNKRDAKKNQEEINNYIQLLKELRWMMNALGEENGSYYRLTTALPGDRRNLIENITEIQKYLNGINLMMYDYHGSWSEETGHNAPLNRTAIALKKYLDAGAQAEKIIFGLPFYGQRWRGVKAGASGPQKNGLGVAVSPNYSSDYGIAYPEILELMKDFEYQQFWDEEAQAPYLYSAKDKVFVSYNDERSIESISSLVKENKLGGMMTWEYGQDMTMTLLEVMHKNCTE